MRTVVPILVLLALPAIVVGQRVCAALDGQSGRGFGRQGGPAGAAAAGRLAHPARRKLLRALPSGARPEGSRHPAAVRRPQGDWPTTFTGRRASIAAIATAATTRAPTSSRPTPRRTASAGAGEAARKMCAVCHENQALDLVKSVHATAGAEERARPGHAAGVPQVSRTEPASDPARGRQALAGVRRSPGADLRRVPREATGHLRPTRSTATACTRPDCW